LFAAHCLKLFASPSQDAFENHFPPSGLTRAGSPAIINSRQATAIRPHSRKSQAIFHRAAEI